MNSTYGYFMIINIVVLYLTQHLDKGLYDKVMKDAAKLNPKAAIVIRNTGTAHNKHNSSGG